ncbi:hypothetical protein FA13DRAFT_1789403 [Coprinellus micaceus]|uniref:Uncharacterized protein n=1 Tax=Coprinellus micaceus TaxID=71717 RepID=A0A4Y7TJZ6_COPMI|nr:hypothetical protein FA13DRAFT_1789403 [Coprinellus micaceus]
MAPTNVSGSVAYYEGREAGPAASAPTESAHGGLAKVSNIEAILGGILGFAALLLIAWKFFNKPARGRMLQSGTSTSNGDQSTYPLGNLAVPVPTVARHTGHGAEPPPPWSPPQDPEGELPPPPWQAKRTLFLCHSHRKSTSPCTMYWRGDYSATLRVDDCSE